MYIVGLMGFPAVVRRGLAGERHHGIICVALNDLGICHFSANGAVACSVRFDAKFEHVALCKRAMRP